ncbi:MAG TPA: DOMON-like domain-containing protein [Gammaproteobacteria bacterium]
MNSIAFTLHPFANESTKTLPITLSGSLLMLGNKINVCYRLSGDITRIQFPEKSASPSRRDQLWNSTCFELFAGSMGKSGYWEYNLSPSHDWAVFSFTDYRTNKADELSISDVVMTTKFDNGKAFELNTILSLPDTLSGHNPDLNIGISAVLQDKSGQRHYYALSHPGQQPDFHHRIGFTIHVNTG